MYRVEECSELIPCPWCGDIPELRSDGLGDHWVSCQNDALPSPSGHTCPVFPSARAHKATLKLGVQWSRDEAIRQWNKWGEGK
jgi:hypothetical protein